MYASRDYERKVIEALTGQVFRRVPAKCGHDFDTSDCGTHPSAGELLNGATSGVYPRRAWVCNKRILIGKSERVETGFVVFLEDHQLTLECDARVVRRSRPYRDQDVEIVAT